MDSQGIQISPLISKRTLAILRSINYLLFKIIVTNGLILNKIKLLIKVNVQLIFFKMIKKTTKFSKLILLKKATIFETR